MLCYVGDEGKIRRNGSGWRFRVFSVPLADSTPLINVPPVFMANSVLIVDFYGFRRIDFLFYSNLSNPLFTWGIRFRGYEYGCDLTVN